MRTIFRYVERSGILRSTSEKRATIPEIKPECDILFLVGDIGNIEDSKYHDFIKYCSEIEISNISIRK